MSQLSTVKGRVDWLVVRIYIEGIENNPGAERCMMSAWVWRDPAAVVMRCLNIPYPDQTTGRTGLWFLLGLDEIVIKIRCVDPERRIQTPPALNGGKHMDNRVKG
jgi:hypothetical protein